MSTSAPAFSAARESRMALAVVMPPVWATTGARPAVCSMTTSNR